MAETVEKKGTHESLKPYFSKLLDLIEKRAGDKESVTISLGDRKLRLEGWEKSIFHKAAPCFSTDERNWKTLVVESICLEAKMLRDIHVYEQSQEGGKPISDKLIEELNLDNFLGQQLLNELQTEVNEMIRVINLENAKKLTQFRFSLRKKLGMLKDIPEISQKSSRQKTAAS